MSKPHTSELNCDFHIIFIIWQRCSLTLLFSVFFCFLFFNITAPQAERNSDWNADGNCIPNANYQV